MTDAAAGHRRWGDTSLPASQVLVTVGTGASYSAMGSTETHRAHVVQDPDAIAYCAFDAGLVDIDLARSTAKQPIFIWTKRGNPERVGEAATTAEVEARFGERLRAEIGIRRIEAPMAPTDIAAPLPFDWEQGGLRDRVGLTFAAVRQSALKDMVLLFDEDPRLGPAMVVQLFLASGLGALAALGQPLATILPEAHRFRVAAACSFSGQDAFVALEQGMQKGAAVEDKVAYRLANLLASQGPAMLTTMLSPAFRLLLVKKDPRRLEQLVDAVTQMRNVPQAPMVSNGACAAAYLTFCDLAPSLLLGDALGQHMPKVALWTAADAALAPDFRIMEGFGQAALMSSAKLDALNEGRVGDERRPIHQALAPFDVDASGTVVGNAGSGLLVTTLQFAMEHGLDVTAIVAGWGQSGETGGKGHMAGVGFGGENALIRSLAMAREAHGFGVTDFRHFIAHATGTRTNSVTDLKVGDEAQRAAAQLEGLQGPLPQMTVGAPKSLGDGHSMGETGLKSAREAIYYLLGEKTVGVPSLRRIDPALGDVAERFQLRTEPVEGDADGGVISTVQGFGGYVGALAMKAANPDSIRRYRFDDPTLLDRYLESWPEIRRERIEREARWRRTRGAAVQLAETHCWPGLQR